MDRRLKKTLDEEAAKLCLLLSSLIRETKVVEAHLTMVMMKKDNGKVDNDFDDYNVGASYLGTLL